jgi:hypothetical protein
MKVKLLLCLLCLVSYSLLAEQGFQFLATFQGESPGNAFSEVCGLGDINQDGYDDFAVGAWESLNGGGYVNIYLGGSALDTIADLRLTGGYYFGWSMDSGYFNGDGIPDLIVGATNPYGSVSVFGGSEDMDTISDIIINGTHSSGFLGYGPVPEYLSLTSVPISCNIQMFRAKLWEELKRGGKPWCAVCLTAEKPWQE